MPHLNIEFSSNILEKESFDSLFALCNKTLSELLPTDIARCKSRAIQNNIYYMGKGEAKNAFIHASIKVMPGRSLETKQNLGDVLMNIFKDHFQDSVKELDLQITIEIIDLAPTYITFKS